MSKSIVCEMCGTELNEEDPNLIEDFESIQEHGRCIDCYEEWGNGYAD